MLPLLGLGDEVVFFRRIRGQQGVRLFAAFGKFAIAEDKGLSSHNVGKGRLNMSIIADGELRGIMIIRNDGDGFGLYTQKDTKRSSENKQDLCKKALLFFINFRYFYSLSSLCFLINFI